MTAIDWKPTQAAMDLLASGDYRQGFAALEAVRFGEGFFRTPRPRLSFPEWTGEPVKSLVVLPEQGLGDLIQHARFIPHLVARGIAVTFYVPPTLVSLFSGLGARVLPVDGQVSLQRHDAWVLAASLPLRLQVTLESLSGRPYLTVPAGLPPRPLGRIGVAWKGGPNNLNDAHRSMTESQARPLLDLEGAVCLHPEATGARDMAETAAIIAPMDVVISVDTSVAHLAGALGKRTLLMLPRLHTDWRWLRNRADSPWYDSIEILRQETPGDWAGVVERAIALV